MRISDWSSDVCSSDLARLGGDGGDGAGFHVDRKAAAVAVRRLLVRRIAQDAGRAKQCATAVGKASLAQPGCQRPVPIAVAGIVSAVGATHSLGDNELAAVEIGHQRAGDAEAPARLDPRSEEHTSELQSLMRNS